MPSILHHEAYEAAAGHAADVDSFQPWGQLELAESLITLPPDRWCGAGYADWLRQILRAAKQAMMIQTSNCESAKGFAGLP